MVNGMDNQLGGDTPMVAFDFEDGRAMGGGTSIVDGVLVTESNAPPPDFSMPRMEIGTVNVRQSNDDQWFKVSFTETIEDAVVFMGPVSTNDDDPAFAAIRNVTDTGFEFQIEEWLYQDGIHGAENLSWLAVSSGTHTLADGRQLLATTVTSDFQGSATVDLEPANLDGFEKDLSVLTQVVSEPGDDPMVVRTGVSSESIGVKLQREEANGSFYGSFDEHSIYVLAVEEGGNENSEFVSGTINVTNVAGQIDPLDSYANVGVLAAVTSLTGNDTTSLRIDAINRNGVSIYLDEETSMDTETKHTFEEVSWFMGDVGVYDLA